MNEISELNRKIDYLEDTLACLRGENAALKAELAQQKNNIAMDDVDIHRWLVKNRIGNLVVGKNGEYVSDVILKLVEEKFTSTNNKSRQGCVICGCNISLRGYCAGCQTRVG